MFVWEYFRKIWWVLNLIGRLDQAMMSQHTSKKRKQPNAGSHADAPAKKSRKEEKSSKDKKGKARNTEFHVVKASLVLSIPPIFASNTRTGVEEMLDSMVMRSVLCWQPDRALNEFVNHARYTPALRGVVLSHSNLHFLTKTATIQADCPFLVCNVGFDATVWSPHVGMKLGTGPNIISNSI